MTMFDYTVTGKNVSNRKFELAFEPEVNSYGSPILLPRDRKEPLLVAIDSGAGSKAGRITARRINQQMYLHMDVAKIFK